MKKLQNPSNSDIFLINAAKEAMKKAYAPYSSFHVGAALMTHDGKIYTGCNIENASYPATCCAERAAIFKAVSDGERDFQKIAIVGGESGKSEGECYPCGVCRQVMSEFFKSETEILLLNENEDIISYTLDEMLPFSFKL